LEVYELKNPTKRRYKMRKAFMVLALGFSGILAGCSPVGISSHSYLTGNPIPEENVRRIQSGVHGRDSSG
jgi:hypothetical protein